MYKDYIVEGVGGMIEENEDPLQAAKRELEEEAGLTAEHFQSLTDIIPAGSIIAWKSHLYIATGIKETKQHLEADEDITVVKIPLEKAVEMVLNREIINSPAIIGILMISKMKT
jgi:ADP-ribose pyrophosphatase